MQSPATPEPKTRSRQDEKHYGFGARPYGQKGASSSRQRSRGEASLERSAKHATPATESNCTTHASTRHRRPADRIRTRVAQGGHDVPEEDAKRRFERSLEQLPDVITHAHETHIYDNSDEEAPHRRVAVIWDGRLWTAEHLPDWAAHAIQKATKQSRPRAD